MECKRSKEQESKLVPEGLEHEMCITEARRKELMEEIQKRSLKKVGDKSGSGGGSGSSGGGGSGGSGSGGGGSGGGGSGGGGSGGGVGETTTIIVLIMETMLIKKNYYNSEYLNTFK